MLANDNTLWAMGLGEHDRNSVIDPIPVLRPLPPEEAEKPSTDEESVKLFDVPADLTGAMLKKGYNRVSVFYPAGMSPYSTDKTKGDHYDVVLHAGLAYFLPLQLDVPMVPVGTDSPLPSLALPTASDVDVESGENKFVEAPVLDYSCGANHTLVLLK